MDQVLAALLRHGGHATQTELQRVLDISPQHLSAQLEPHIAVGRLLRVGPESARHLLLPREVPGVGQQVPIHQVLANGQIEPLGTLIPLARNGFWMEEVDTQHGQSAAHDSLPWFLTDTRPQGFLGRAFVQAHGELELPQQLADWSDDHILRALVCAGEDLPGNLLVGDASLARYLQLPTACRSSAPLVTDRIQEFPRLAEKALAQAAGGSSAGGEQPKFSAVCDGHPVLVKFSPGGSSPADQRWRDLLLCEAMALQLLSAEGVEAARTDIVLAERRVFLQSRRFDRTPLGRIGMVSLGAYDDQYLGHDGWTWTDTAAVTHRAGAEALLPQDTRTLRLLDAFGSLIANTDRHRGNVSLLLREYRWRLAPAYDMLPMFYAPVGSELVPRNWPEQPPRPNANTEDVWGQAREMALRFWQQVSTDQRISPDFQHIARTNAAIVQAL